MWECIERNWGEKTVRRDVREEKRGVSEKRGGNWGAKTENGC